MKLNIRIKAALLTVSMAAAMAVPGCAPKSEASLEPVSESSTVADTTTVADTGTETPTESDIEETTSETIPSSLHMDPPDVDTTAPVFISYPRTIQLLKGKEFVAQDYVGYIDDVDRDVDFKVTGTVDVNTVGDYPIKMTITDDAGNSKTIDVTVKVYVKKQATKKPTSSSSSKPSSTTTKAKKTTFEDLKKKYETGNAFIGIDVSKYKIRAYMLSAAIVSLGGSLYAQYMLYFDPASIMTLNVSMMIVLVAVMGGIGTVLGPILGAVIIECLSEYTRSFLGRFGGLDMVLYGVLVIIIVLFLPGGLLTLPAKIREWADRRKAGVTK